MIVGFDFETFPIGPDDLPPEPVCLSTCLMQDPADEGAIDLSTSADKNMRQHTIDVLYADVVKVTVNGAFDLAVACKEWPELLEVAFDELVNGRIKDCGNREKLLNLAEFGELKFAKMPDGSNAKINYSLEELAERYLGVTLNKTKMRQGKLVGEEDAWRINYHHLVGLKLKNWPMDAINYALADAVYTAQIYYKQEERRARVTEKIGMDPLATEDLRTAADFCLFLMTCHGLRLDPERHGKIRERVAAQLTPDKLNLIVEAGILRPEQLPRPHARGAKLHEEGCDKKGCECPAKMTKGTKASINKKKLQAFVVDLAKEFDNVTLAYTVKSEKFPERPGFPNGGQISVNAEWLADYAGLSPVLKQYQHRAGLQKLVTTDLPRIEWPKGSGVCAKTLHPCYDVLKETGRTSSYASSLYPSSCVNPHPEIRQCGIPRDGYHLMSVDYSGMELGTLAQTCINLFGYSVLADKINAGYDFHTWFGAQLANFFDGDFNTICSDAGVTDTDEIHDIFLAMKGHEDPAVAKFFKHYRKLAKPTDLGFPGGLGPETFCTYAHGTFGVDVTLDMATELRSFWKKTLPEMKDYLEWINTRSDPHHDGHFYSTPLGMYRANCSYCAAANGLALQSPSAEGALMAVCNVVSETFLPGSVLSDDEKGYRHRPILFIHDEIVSEVREDVAHECAQRVSEIMIAAMRLITPDVRVGANPCLMNRWNKEAEPVFNSAGRLIPWEPKEQK